MFSESGLEENAWPSHHCWVIEIICSVLPSVGPLLLSMPKLLFRLTYSCRPLGVYPRSVVGYPLGPYPRSRLVYPLSFHSALNFCLARLNLSLVRPGSGRRGPCAR